MTTRSAQKVMYWPTAKAYAVLMGVRYPITLAKAPKAKRVKR